MCELYNLCLMSVFWTTKKNIFFLIDKKRVFNSIIIQAIKSFIYISKIHFLTSISNQIEVETGQIFNTYYIDHPKTS